MPQYNRSELDLKARSLGFNRDTFEKVLRLSEILNWIYNHPYLSDHLLLKGGTAINLTVFSLPRLSVDIDLDYTPNVSREEMLESRSTITQLLNSYMGSEGYSISPASRMHHSLDALYYSYTNAAGNPDMIKIEINYSLRAHLLPASERSFQLEFLESDDNIITVDPMEIYAAKVNALLSRTAARDLYDINNMITNNMFNDKKDLFRKCIIFYMSVSQKSVDPTFNTDAINNLSFQKIRRDLFPVLGSDERNQKFDLESRKNDAIKYIQSIMTLTDNENEYLRKFADKEFLPSLLFDDDDIIERIKMHPMALWKCNSN